MVKGSILYDRFLSHPNKLYSDHITNMYHLEDTKLEREVKRFHDIAKLKDNFQRYIRGDRGIDKNHSLLSGYIYLLNSNFEDRDLLFGFLAIISHHSSIENFFRLNEANIYIGKYATSSKELDFLDEVITYAQSLELYQELNGSIEELELKITSYQRYLRKAKRKKIFSYSDFIDFKKLYSSLIYADKYEAIWSQKRVSKKPIDPKILTRYIDNLPYHQRRDNFRRYVLNNFNNTQKLFTLTAPTGYGKTLTALEFALKFGREKIIFALPFTSIIDQVYSVVSDILDDIDIYKIHHKTTIDESIPKDRYSKEKFLMTSFSGDINITTLYQIIFALFGNKNRDNVKFNQFRDAVVIIDEAQSIPYPFRKDFIKLCELISDKMNTVFIFMSATMPIMSDSFREISTLDYFKEQNRYVLEWLELESGQSSLIKKVYQEAKSKHTLVVVNTIKKAQELYIKFSDEFDCYCLNGYMTDFDKQRVIKKVSNRLKDDSNKILLISTQSIEAGVDLDFEVGFREVAPISSIIQTAGRVNRHFGNTQSTLYIFDDICGYSDLIYGDIQMISKAIFEVLKSGVVKESNILELSELYFQKISSQLENLYIGNEVELLEFANINQKIKTIMDNDYKELIIIEPYSGFMQEVQDELYRIRREESDKFIQKDLIPAQVKKMLQYGVNVSKKDKESFGTPIIEVKSLHKMIYLPSGTMDYDKDYGVRKYQSDEVEMSDIGF